MCAIHSGVRGRAALLAWGKATCERYSHHVPTPGSSIHTRVWPALVALSAMLVGCGSTVDAGTLVSTGANPTALSVGVTIYPSASRPSIPELAGPTLDGGPLALSSLRGHVVVINVWASWCEPCRAESPALARVADATRSAGVRFVGIDEQDRAAPAREFAASVGATYPHLLDSDGSLLSSLRLVPSSGIPSTLVLDAQGRVAARVIGPVDPATFETLVRSVVSGESASRTP